MKGKKRETLQSLRLQIRRLQQDLQQQKERWFASGYNEGRASVTNALRELLGIDKL